MASMGQQGTPQLNLHLLGPPVVTLDGQYVKINRRELRALLFYLAGNLEPVSRSEICDVFWPKDSDQTSRKKLREALSRLRKSLSDQEFIISHNDSISLNHDRVCVDYREYLKVAIPIIGSAEMNSTGKLPDWCYSQLRDVLNQHKGVEFLQGISMPDSIDFENWVASNNHSYSLSREKALQRLIDHCIAIGNLDEAIFWIEVASKSDPLNADLNFLQVYCLKEKGHIQEAINYLNDLESRYRTNLHESLPQTMVDFRKRLEIGFTKEEEKPASMEWPDLDTGEVPFVGRDEPLKLLLNAYYRKGCVCVHAESGAGKTRLVQEFFSRLDFKPTLLHCSGNGLKNEPPLEPFILALKRVLTPADWQNLPDFVRNELSPYLAEPGFIPDEHAIPASSDESLAKLFNGFHQVLQNLAQKKPLLMVVDHIQWCDKTLFEFLTYLNVRHFFRQYGLLVLINSPEEPNPDFERFLDRGILSAQIQTLHLKALSRSEIAQFISIVMGRLMKDSTTEKVSILTGGNPFLLLEILRSIGKFESEEDFLTAITDFPLPAVVHSFIHEKARSLSDKANLVFQSAAVLGQNFLTLVLEGMIDLTTEEFAEAMEELRKKGFFYCDLNESKESCCNFVHGVDRLYLLQTLSPVISRKLHLRAVSALKKIKGEAPELAALYAMHNEKAGEMVSAFESWCVAGRYAHENFSRDEVNTYYQRAMDLIPVLPSHEVPDHYKRLLIEWGDHAYDVTDIELSRKLYQDGLEWGESKQDAAIIGLALSGFGRVGEMSGEWGEGVEALKRSLYYLSLAGTMSDQMEAFSRLAILHELMDHYTQAREVLSDALNISYNPSDLDVITARFNLKAQLSLINSLTGWPEQAGLLANQVVDECRLINRQSAKVQAYSVLALAQHFKGFYTKSNQNAGIAHRLSGQMKMVWWNGLLDLIMARNCLLLGKLDESWYYAEHSLDGRDPALLPKLLLQGNTIKGDIYRMLGDLNSAELYYRGGEQKDLKDFESLDQQLYLGLVYCQKDQIERGLKIINQVVVSSQAQGLGSLYYPAKLLSATWSMASSDEKTVRREIEPLIEQMKHHGFGQSWAYVDLVTGYLNLRSGQVERARNLFRRVIQEEHSSQRWFELWAWVYLCILSDADEKEKKTCRREANSILDDLSAHATQKPVSTLFRKFRKNLESSMKT